ncbi:MAG: hypothetical protein K8F34_12275 [Candidatus Kuenenia stuttgartiensis]|jgi:hypothetical protein|uniref:hypothetical protein n=1 Tax=Candidatus Kuenenia TaxID=380738 RepID=UPI00146D594F|nr:MULTISPECIES: hypothetical protein [Kuenenia]MBZ0192448.1 hypothetical protein [Candidatus Kuenenia stuttgartiensis]MCZ7623030.1 hypothetical protein [Candidatus Kuenenia sp.]
MTSRVPCNNKPISFGWLYTFEPVQKLKCQMFPTQKSELLKCLFYQKVAKLINYSEIGKDSIEGIPIAGWKMA